jgi:hypothetical protein
MEMLQRFEDESSDPEEDCLESRLSGLDLDEASPDEILSCLSPEEAEKFERLVREGGLDILDAEDGVIWTPWWMDLLPKVFSLVTEVDAVDQSDDVPSVIFTPSFGSITRTMPSPLILKNVLDLMYIFYL